MGFTLLERFKANDDYLKEEEKMTLTSKFNDVGFGETNGSAGIRGRRKRIGGEPTLLPLFICALVPNWLFLY